MLLQAEQTDKLMEKIEQVQQGVQKLTGGEAVEESYDSYKNVYRQSLSLDDDDNEDEAVTEQTTGTRLSGTGAGVLYGDGLVAAVVAAVDERIDAKLNDAVARIEIAVTAAISTASAAAATAKVYGNYAGAAATPPAARSMRAGGTKRRGSNGVPDAMRLARPPGAESNSLGGDNVTALERPQARMPSAPADGNRGAAAPAGGGPAAHTYVMRSSATGRRLDQGARVRGPPQL
eukprot:1399891-Prymnesium_polylepis.2